MHISFLKLIFPQPQLVHSCHLWSNEYKGFDVLPGSAPVTVEQCSWFQGGATLWRVRAGLHSALTPVSNGSPATHDVVFSYSSLCWLSGRILDLPVLSFFMRCCYKIGIMIKIILAVLVFFLLVSYKLLDKGKCSLHEVYFKGGVSRSFDSNVDCI